MTPFTFGRKLAHEIHELDAEGVALHPHQRRRLVLFGLLVGALAFGAGFALIQNDRQSQSDLLRKVGAVPMSATALKSEISHLKISFKPYWLGAITSMRYEADTSESRETVIRYIQSTMDSSIHGKNVYTVESYKNETAYGKDVSEQDFSTDTEFVSNHRTIRYLKKTMAYLTVRIAGNNEVFEIHCSQPQTLMQLDDLAQSLTPVV